MRLPAVSLSTNHTAVNAAVYGSGEYGCAVAALLALIGHQVRLFGVGPTQTDVLPTDCDVVTQSGARYTSHIQLDRATASSALRSSDVVIIGVPATEYSGVAEELSHAVSSGQTILIIGAALGASLEIATVIERRRRDLNVNLVEISSPFSSCEFDGKSITMNGVRERLCLAGRNLNETRVGLSVGSTLLNGLVPASNIIDRAFSDTSRWLETAAILFNSFDRSHAAATTGDAFDCSPEDNANAIVAALATELESLARAYGLRGSEQPRRPDARKIHVADWRGELISRVIEDYVLLSGLARLAYVPVPIIDTVIELGSVLTKVDLRKEARQLTDLGLIGMDAQEILDYVN